MILKKIKLENIRSYENVEINFPIGTTLLSGDIGSGKSTIFLAIEFCLFGVQRGELSGAGILRHGAKQGSLELTFQVNNREIQIKRMLKRSSNNSVTQDPGFIIIDDQPKQLSPTEIKQRVIELLGYPSETLTKKSPIYRYTVFTPQEQMKTILTSDKESRIDTLRRVFDIDRYKIIRANAKIFIQEIKGKRREFASTIHDLEDKKEEVNQKNNRIAELEIEKNKINTEEIKKTLDKIKYEIIKLEEEIKNINELKQNLLLKNEKINQLAQSRQKNSERLLQLEEKIKRSETYDAPKYSSEEIKKHRMTYEDTITNFSEKLRETQDQIVRFRSQKESSNELNTKIKSLNNCPTCLQTVGDTHKRTIIEKEVQKINQINTELEKYLHQERDLRTAVESAKSKLDNLRKEENKVKVQELMKKEVQETQLEKDRITQEQESLKEQIKELNQAKLLIEEKLETTTNLEYTYNQKKTELNQVQEEEREISIKYATKTKEITMIQEEILQVKREITNKEKTKKKLERHSQIQEWLEKMFIPMMEEIEKATMFKIKHEFDKLLQTWFNMLVEDEGISITIDEDFTPIIDQNGHTTEYDYLSGGERTAAALAYRLALNQTINDVISKIKTKDLIMLDEPTEGFSSEQLDKLRDILVQLEVKQILLVSHESKVESFVENVIKVNKTQGKSTIEYS